MHSDGLTKDFIEFRQSHRETCTTPITYEIEYDEHAWVETAAEVAGRLWITTSRPDEKPTRIEVVLITAIRDGKRSKTIEVAAIDASIGRRRTGR